MTRDPERVGSALRLASSVAVLISVTLWGCARHPAEPVGGSGTRQAVLEPARSERGNPPFYEVMGQRHYVLDSAAGYRMTGVASWYGEKFHGRETSSGEVYDMYGLTAAHTTLPLPTWVEVTHLENGRRVVVKINDRGPFLHNRIIDLSYGAAEALNMVSAGTAPVEVRVLGAPAVRSTQRIYLQAGAFTRQDSATRLADMLTEAGFAQINIDADDMTSPNLYRVRLGPFKDVDAVDAAIASIIFLGLDKPHLVIGP